MQRPAPRPRNSFAELDQWLLYLDTLSLSELEQAKENDDLAQYLFGLSLIKDGKKKLGAYWIYESASQKNPLAMLHQARFLAKTDLLAAEQLCIEAQHIALKFGHHKNYSSFIRRATNHARIEIFPALYKSGRKLVKLKNPAKQETGFELLKRAAANGDAFAAYRVVKLLTSKYAYKDKPSIIYHAQLSLYLSGTIKDQSLNKKIRGLRVKLHLALADTLQLMYLQPNKQQLIEILTHLYIAKRYQESKDVVAKINSLLDLNRFTAKEISEYRYDAIIAANNVIYYKSPDLPDAIIHQANYDPRLLRMSEARLPVVGGSRIGNLRMSTPKI